MDDKTHTTQTLRETLFNTIERVLSGDIDAKQAAQVANVADKIIKTADLEMRYSEHLSHLDKDDTGIAAGPMLLGAPEAKK